MYHVSSYDVTSATQPKAVKWNGGCVNNHVAQHNSGNCTNCVFLDLFWARNVPYKADGWDHDIQKETVCVMCVCV